MSVKYYTKILIWENEKRLSKLREFRSLTIRYFNNSQVGFGGGRVEGDTAREARSRINLLKDEIHAITLSAGTNPTFSWTSPASVGGYAIEINLIENIFDLDRFNIAPSNSLAVIDRAIEKYDSNRKATLVRTYNPFFYLSWLLHTFSDLPFIAIGIFGFNREKIKASVIGKLVKGVLYLIVFVALFLMILHLAGFLERIKGVIYELLELGKPLDLEGNPYLPKLR